MNNPIVHSLYQMFGSRGFSVLRFNFRGTGGSEGRHDAGTGERHGAPQHGHATEPVDQAGPDPDVVGARAQAHGEGADHGWAVSR